MPASTDATLHAEVLAAARGDRDAFARLVSATSGMVTAIALAEARDEDVARDAAQDVYLQVWNGLGRLRQPASFLPWLRQATRRQARRLRLVRRRMEGGEPAQAALREAAATEPGPGERLLDAERAALVREALEALPDEARETVVLYYREGHSTAQVAQLLGLSDAAVQQRLSRARARLREDLLARLGEAVALGAPGSAFTAGVVALLVPRAAEALAAAAGGAVGAAPAGGATGASAAAVASDGAGLGAMVSGGKVAVIGAAAAALLAGLALTLAPGGGTAPPATTTIARPPGERTPGEPLREASPLRLEQPPAGALEIRITAAGAARGGADVRAYLRVPFDEVSGGAAWRLAGQASADAGGLARLPAGPGTYLVAVRAPGLAAAQRAVVRPEGEATTRVEVALEQPASLAGRTVDRAGRPVALAALRLVPEPEGGRVAAALPEEEVVFGASDGSGAFHLDGLAPGAWRLTAEAAGHARTAVHGLRLPRSGPLEVVLDAAGLLEGRVVGPEGRPVPGAEILLTGGPELLRLEAGPAGGFATEVQPGAYRLSARQGALAGSLGAPVQVAAGGAVKGLSIALGAASRFTGRIADGEGQPIVGALLQVQAADGSGEVARAVTDASGRYRTAPLAPGEYDLAAHAAGRSPARRKGLVLLAGQRFEANIDLEGTGTIAGQVSSTGGAPLPGIRVEGIGLGDGASAAEAVTGADGRYRLERHEVGRFHVHAHWPGIAVGVDREVVVEAGRTVTADLALPALGTLEGRVSRADGKPLTGDASLTVGPYRTGWYPHRMAHPALDGDGRFRVDLPEGRHAAFASDERGGFMGGAQPIEIRAGALAQVEIVLAAKPADTQLEVRVVEPGGAPAGGAVVRIASPSARFSGLADGQGQVRFTASGAAEAAPVLISARKGGRSAREIRVPPGARDVTVQLLPGAALRGRVDGGDRPPAGFTAALGLPPLGEERTGEEVRRQLAGDRLELLDLPAGDATLLVQADDGRTGRAEVALRPGEAAEVTVRLEAPARLRARPVDGAGRVVRDAWLVVGARPVDADPEGLFRRPADARDGWLEGGGIPAGRVRVEIGARCFEAVRRDVELRSGETLDLGDVVLAPVPPERCWR